VGSRGLVAARLGLAVLPLAGRCRFGPVRLVARVTVVGVIIAVRRLLLGSDASEQIVDAGGDTAVFLRSGVLGSGGFGRRFGGRVVGLTVGFALVVFD